MVGERLPEHPRRGNAVFGGMGGMEAALVRAVPGVAGPGSAPLCSALPRWECRVPAASLAASSAWAPQGTSVGCRTGTERGGGEAARRQCSLRGQAVLEKGAGFVAVRGHCQQHSLAPFAICRFPRGGSCLGALDHKGLEELG